MNNPLVLFSLLLLFVLSVLYLVVRYLANPSSIAAAVRISERFLGNMSTRSPQNATETPPFPIDVVYTWAGEGNEDSMRLGDHGELKYSLRSVFENMPWVRHVFIVMNEKKKPSWFRDDYEKFVTLVGHDQIFSDGIPANLPTTNSNSIETALSNIPGLSEHFIYFNDDFFVSRPISYKRFFNNKGQAMIQPNLQPVKLGSTASFKGPLPEFASGFHSHVPLALRKSGFEDFKAEYREWVAFVRSIKKRAGLGCDVCEPYNLPCPCQQIHGTVSNYLEKKGLAKKGPLYADKVIGPDISYFNHYNAPLMEKASKDDLADTFAVNDTAETPEERKKYGQIIRSFLGRIFSRPAKIEANSKG